MLTPEVARQMSNGFGCHIIPRVPAQQQREGRLFRSLEIISLVSWTTVETELRGHQCSLVSPMANAYSQLSHVFSIPGFALCRLAFLMAGVQRGGALLPEVSSGRDHQAATLQRGACQRLPRGSVPQDGHHAG